MEFTWINKQGVASDQGFEVQMIDRDSIEYGEDGKTITVGVEMGMRDGRPCLLISPGSFSRWDGSSADLIFSDAEQKRLESNFFRAMRFQGVPVFVEDPDR